jgi:gliding motility-associated-like protein
MMRLKLLSYTFIVCAFMISNTLKGQTSNENWAVEWSHPKAFIENKGQFDGRDFLKNTEILYGIDHGSTAVYFKTNGLTYRFYEWYKTPGRVKGDSTKPKRLIRNEIIHMEWLNANPMVTIEASLPRSDYYTYSMLSEDRKSYYDIREIRGYEQITYKNLYEGIDVIYEFHPEGGIKYNLLVQSGADISQIAMKYSDGTKLSISSDGKLHIATMFGDITEHAPVTFYSSTTNEIIPSAFVIHDNTVSFVLDNPDTDRAITIDPWVVTPTMANSNGVWEIDKDDAGNVYIIGGDMPMKLQKYNPAGALQWTYNTPWDTANNWLGTLTTDFNGNAFITSGSSAALQKVNTSGAMQWSVNGGAMDEYWMITFNCDHTKLIIGGTRLDPFVLANSHGVIFDIDINNGSVLSLQEVAGTRPGPMGIFDEANEVRALTSSRTGRYYYLTLEDVGCINQNFNLCSSNNQIFHILSDYMFSYKSENYRPDNGNSGIRAIRTSKNFLYTQNGSHVQKRDLTDGSIITTVPITGGISTSTMGFNQPGNNGIAVDTCGNVYVGSGNRVIKYDANLNVISFETTAFPVFDVVVTPGGNVVVVGTTGAPSATNRVGYIQSFNMSACVPLALSCCLTAMCPAGPFCHDDPNFQLIVDQSGGTFSGTGVNPSTGMFSPTTAGPGTHTITYSLPCGSSSINIVVNYCDSLHVCMETNGDLTVTGGVGPYTWYEWIPAQSTPITNQTECQNCGYTWFFGTCLDGMIPVTTCDSPAQWSQFATGSTVTPPSNWPVMVNDASTNSSELADYVSIPACVPCDTIIINVTNINNVSCYGADDGSFTASASGGTTPYTFILRLGATTITAFNNVTGPQNFTGLGPGNYVLTVTDANSCSETYNITITEPPQIIPGTPVITDTDCALDNGSATINPTGGVPPYTYAWNTVPQQTTQTAVNMPAGSYVVTITDDNGCTATAAAYINDSDGPVAAVTVIDAICGANNGSITLVITGGTPPYDVQWAHGASGTSLTDLLPGTYTFTISDSDSCVRTEQVTVDDLQIDCSQPHIYVPNVFSPNGDGENDLLYVRGDGISNIEFLVFSRWGNKVFETTDINKGWDGTYKGAPVDPGVFTWMVKGIFVTNEEFELSGTVTLVK